MRGLWRCLRVLAVAAALTAPASVPAAAADTGPPQGGGGCHMVQSPSSTGLDQMMTGSANGNGAAEMGDMLKLFSPDPFCGV